MSISYEELHAKALPFVPEGTVKNTTTWIAILLHSITSLKEINGRKDFLWLKCHGRITLKTIKHEYFTRHPLEDFHLKYHDVFPDEEKQVKLFSRNNPVKNTNVVVFRAIEDINMPNELGLADAAKRKRALEGRGQISDDAIAIGDDSDEEPTSSDEPAGKKRKLAGDGSHDEAGSGQITNDAEVTDGTDEVDLAAAMAAYRPPYPEWDWTAFFNRMSTLPSDVCDRIDATPWWHCELCGKQMLLKPWTYFGPANRPLCTNDSEQQMQAMGHNALIAKMHQQREEEFAEKHLQMSIGNPQNTDFDAGINWPYELGNIHMNLPMNAAAVPEEENAGLVEVEDEDEDEDVEQTEEDAGPDYHGNEVLDEHVAGEEMQEDDGDDEEEDDHLEDTQRWVEDAGQQLTNENLHVYTVATTINKPPSPPTSDSGEDRAMDNFRQELAKQQDDDAASEDSFATAGEEGEQGFAF